MVVFTVAKSTFVLQISFQYKISGHMKNILRDKQIEKAEEINEVTRTDFSGSPEEIK